MPMVWVEADEVIRAGGVRIYNAYKNGDYSNPLHYHYTTDISGDECGCECFDIRDLPVYREMFKAGYDHRAILLASIRDGTITEGGVSERE